VSGSAFADYRPRVWVDVSSHTILVGRVLSCAIDRDELVPREIRVVDMITNEKKNSIGIIKFHHAAARDVLNWVLNKGEVP